MMAQCKQTPQDFIKNAFTPQIAVLCTPNAEKSCEKNNLNFTELLQPFSKLTSDVSYKDPSGNVTIIKSLKLKFLDVSQVPPQPTLARKLLNSSVSDAAESKQQIYEAKNYKLNIPSSTPWYEEWRDTFLKVQYPSDHEFTKHFLACLLVVSSSDINPLETMVQLAQSLYQIQSNMAQGKLPKWFSPDILKYYIIIHDNVEGNHRIANEVFESLKISYGSTNCFLLRMNSRPPGVNVSEHLADPWSQFLSSYISTKNFKGSAESSPNQKRQMSMEIAQEANESKSPNYHPLSIDLDDVLADSFNAKDESITNNVNQVQSHGSCLSVDDIEQIKAMVFEFCKYCLMPHLEKQLVMLNDAVSLKKGVSKSLFSATKRWFTATKPGSSTSITNLIYSPDSPELQIRKIGDLYFMFGNYSNAFQAFHLAKRDYNVDQAWLYYAGALEMAALSAFMASESNRKTFDYMEESIATYLNTCKMPQFATRATMLSLECLKSKNMFGESAHQLIRMTSEDSDLRSALLLEQAAYCFLFSNMLRKYAFHMVLAGHRFSKAAQKHHSLRCYKQAYEIYENTGWDLAGDHIHYTIGRQANNLQNFSEAVESFSKLLKGESKQSAQQQAIFLKEYLWILESKLKNEDQEDTIPILPVPKINNSMIKLLLGPTRPLSTPGKVPALGINFNNSEDAVGESRWYKLEEMLVSEANGSPPLVFKPMITLYTSNAMDKSNPVAIINEPIQVSIQLVNDLQTVVLIKDIYLLWCYSNDDEVVTNSVLNSTVDKYIKTYVTKSQVLQGNSKQELVLSLTPLVTGKMVISAICYTLNGSESIQIKGKQLLNVSTSSEVKPITIMIVPFAPCLQMTFSELNLEFLAGELQRVSVVLQNTGSVPLKNILLATSVPHLLSNCELCPEENYFIDVTDAPAIRDKLARKNHISSIPLSNNRLEGGQTTSFNIWIKAPPSKGAAFIDMLVYYENIDSNSIPRYRLIRHCWNLSVQESLSIDGASQTSYTSTTEEELALALKVTNLNKFHNAISTEINLLNIGLLSRNWILTKDIVTPKYINLKSQESAHILFKAKRKVHKQSHYSSVTLNTEKASIPNLGSAYLAFTRKVERTLINTFDEAADQKDSRDGILILEWKAKVYDASNKRIVNGHSFVPIEVSRKNENEIQLDKIMSDTLINATDALEPEEKSLVMSQKQVFYNLIHPPLVVHNFQKMRHCIVPVTLVIHSVIDEVISVTIDTIDNSAKSVSTRTVKSNLYSPIALDNLCWLVNGKTMRILDPLTTTSVKLSVIVTSPGTFDLGANLAILCSRIDKEEVPVMQSCEIHTSLIVQGSCS